jgi:uncharacterized membrane protein YoaT (DUF817 family)
LYTFICGAFAAFIYSAKHSFECEGWRTTATTAKKYKKQKKTQQINSTLLDNYFVLLIIFKILKMNLAVQKERRR